MADHSPPPPFPASQDDAPFLFASYAHADSALVFPELERLHKEGYRVWYDEGINPGEVFTEALERALKKAHQVVAFVSPRFANSDFCKDEIHFALDEKKPLLLIHLEPNVLQKALRYRRLQHILKFDQTTQRYYDLVARALPEMLRGSKPPAPPRVLEATGSELQSLRQRRRELIKGNADPAQIQELDRQLRALKRPRPPVPQLLLDDCLAQRYYLLKELGHGGFGTVWMAEDDVTGLVVAVKVLHPQYNNNAERLDRFKQGARIMHQLAHPHVVRILNEYREAGGYHYFVMEYISDTTLAQAVLSGALERKRLLKWLLQTGAALSHAHQRGWVHRDVTPENILLTTDQNAKLTDFDLVRVPDATVCTPTGALGKFTYAAPECMNNANLADVRSDVYSLGMTGVFGFFGQSLPMQAVFERDAFLRQLNCPKRVKAVLVKAVKYDPAARFATMTEFCQALRDAVKRDVSKTAQQIPPSVEVAHPQPGVFGKAAPARTVTPDAVPPALATYREYRVLRELGRGGMGVVYLAEHTVLKNTVALKVISSALVDNAEAIRRFMHEVREVIRLHHINIVRVTGLAQVGDRLVLVMEFVDGVSLADRVENEGPLPVLYACNYIQQAALGLQHAFEQVMVHGNIKPHNLMLTPEGRVKILDFGLARMACERSKGGLTADGAFVRTPGYIAPEQATDARTADIRADIYSLGCTLYFLLTGRLPFVEDTPVKQVLAHIEKEAPPLHHIRRDIPEALSAVVANMLAKNPADRYQTPNEVARALEPFVQQGA